MEERKEEELEERVGKMQYENFAQVQNTSYAAQQLEGSGAEVAKLDQRQLPDNAEAIQQ